MRLDKYLKVSRLIKRRTVAAEACDGGKGSVNGRVLVNQKPAKAGYQVKKGDIIQIQFGEKQISFKVIYTEEKEARLAGEPMFEEI